MRHEENRARTHPDTTQHAWNRNARRSDASTGTQRVQSALAEKSHSIRGSRCELFMFPSSLPPHPDTARSSGRDQAQAPSRRASPRSARGQRGHVAGGHALHHCLGAAALLVVKVEQIGARPRRGRRLGTRPGIRDGRRGWARDDRGRVKCGRVRVHGQHPRAGRMRHRRRRRQDGKLLAWHGVAPVQSKNGGPIESSSAQPGRTMRTSQSQVPPLCRARAGSRPTTPRWGSQ